MRKTLSITLIVALAVVGGFMLINHFGPNMGTAWARGWGGAGGGGGCPMSYSGGTPGGGDYTPQRGNNSGSAYGTQGELSGERARDILSGHLARLNPSLQVGQGTDAGTHYEFDITSEGQTVERLAVDKRSGMVRPVQ